MDVTVDGGEREKFWFKKKEKKKGKVWRAWVMNVTR